MLVHQDRPLLRRQPSKEAVRMRGAPRRTAAANRSISPHSRSRSVPKSRSSCTTKSCIVGEFRRIGSSSRSARGFTIHPMSRPMKTRGGVLSPNANSTPAEQCATACGAFILPHSRWLSGFNNAIRSFTSFHTCRFKEIFHGPHAPDLPQNQLPVARSINQPRQPGGIHAPPRRFFQTYTSGYLRPAGSWSRKGT